MEQLVAILASVFVVSLISFVGVIFIGLKEKVLKQILMLLIGFSSGTLIGSAFLDLLPEALEANLGAFATFSCVIVGIVFFFAMEKFLYWRHCHEEECPVHMFAYLNLIGDGTYNFVTALTAVAGAVITYFLVFLQDIKLYLIPFAAGGFIYIAATDLMPELHKKSKALESVVQLASILLGIGLMAYLASAIGG